MYLTLTHSFSVTSENISLFNYIGAYFTKPKTRFYGQHFVADSAIGIMAVIWRYFASSRSFKDTDFGTNRTLYATSY